MEHDGPKTNSSHEQSTDKENLKDKKARWIREKHLEYDSLLTEAAPDRQKLDKWRQNHEEGLASDLADVVAKNLNYVSFDMFLNALYDVVTEVADKTQGEEVVILTKVKGKSEAWVYDLVKDLLPENHEVVDFSETEKLKGKGKKNFVYLDDAAYSGSNCRNMAASLAMIREDGDSEFRFYPATAFYTQNSDELLSERTKKKGDFIIVVNLESRKKMPTMEEILDQMTDVEARNRLKIYINRAHEINLHQTLTWFQHKIPDGFSLYEGVSQGYIIGNNGSFVEDRAEKKKRVSFIPIVIEPYRENISKIQRTGYRIKDQLRRFFT